MYDQSACLQIGARVRRLVLGIVLFVSLLLNAVFAICTLVSPVSIYALMVYALVISGVAFLAEYTVADAEEIFDAVMANAHPTTMRAPVAISYGWIIGAWLAWWTISQTLWVADIVYQQTLVPSVVLLSPLCIAIVLRLSARSLWQTVEPFILFALQLITFVLLFVPTEAWAPQYIGVAMVCARVLLFFGAIMLSVFLEPPGWDVCLDEETARELPIEKELKTLLHNALADDTVLTQQRRARFARVRAVLTAYYRAKDEDRNMRGTVAMTAWVLVLPTTALLIVYPLQLFSMVYYSAKVQRTYKFAFSKTPVAVPQQRQQQQQQQPTPVQEAPTAADTVIEIKNSGADEQPSFSFNAGLKPCK